MMGINYAEEAVVDDYVLIGDDQDAIQSHSHINMGPAPTVYADHQRPRQNKTRSLSDGGNVPKLSPSPHILEATKRTSKDDTSIHNPTTSTPITPLRSSTSASIRETGPQAADSSAVAGAVGSDSLSLHTQPKTAQKEQHQHQYSSLVGKHSTSLARDFVPTSAGTTPHFASPFTPTPSIAGSSSKIGVSNNSATAYPRSGALRSSNASVAHLNANTEGGFVMPSSSRINTNVVLDNASSTFAKPVTTPISPKVDSQMYASPTHILPRNARGLDVCPPRAATSLSHSTLADQGGPDASPSTARKAVNIPGRRPGDFGPENSSSSLWSVMGSTAAGGCTNHHTYLHDRPHMSHFLGSTSVIPMDSSSSSDDDDYMEDDIDEAFVTTPNVAKMGTPARNASTGVPWSTSSNGSPALNAMNSAAFQVPQRRIKQPKRKLMGALGLNLTPSPGLSKSPPTNLFAKDLPHARRESISWAANQLHISSGNDSDESLAANRAGKTRDADAMPSTPSRDGPQRPNVIRRTVTRRQNLLPKTKGFARIKAELIEESAPVETDLRRESQVMQQVRDSDMDLEPKLSATTTALSSPFLGAADDVVDVPEDMMITDMGSTTLKQKAMKNVKSNKFWDTFSECSSIGGTRTTPPPHNFLSRGSTAGFGEDVNMDSPAAGSKDTQVSQSSISGVAGAGSQSDSQQSGPLHMMPLGHPPSSMIPPTVAEITRRINTKRRRDDDFDPVSFKRRAVSPGMSVHNSPIMQSPLQRDIAPWGSRPGSNGGEKSSAGSETGSLERTGSGPARAKGRVGYQGMVDTNDGIMRMSIE